MMIIDPPPFGAPAIVWSKFKAWLDTQDQADPIVQAAREEYDLWTKLTREENK